MRRVWESRRWSSIVDLGHRPGAANAGTKVMTLVPALALGADRIDDCDILRADRTDQVLGHVIAAPSTLGTFLRAFTFGHVRRLGPRLGETLERAWAAGAGPGSGRLVVDVDSFVGEVHGRAKQGAAFGTPVSAATTRCSRRGRTPARFFTRARRTLRAGATEPKLLRADSGFWSGKTFDRLDRAGWQFSIGVRLQPQVREVIEQIDENAWMTLEDYPPTSIAQIAEATLGDRRLIVRRVRTLNKQGELLPS